MLVSGEKQCDSCFSGMDVCLEERVGRVEDVQEDPHAGFDLLPLLLGCLTF